MGPKNDVLSHHEAAVQQQVAVVNDRNLFKPGNLKLVGDDVPILHRFFLALRPSSGEDRIRPGLFASLEAVCGKWRAGR